MKQRSRSFFVGGLTVWIGQSGGFIYITPAIWIQNMFGHVSFQGQWIFWYVEIMKRGGKALDGAFFDLLYSFSRRERGRPTRPQLRAFMKWQVRPSPRLRVLWNQNIRSSA